MSKEQWIDAYEILLMAYIEHELDYDEFIDGLCNMGVNRIEAMKTACDYASERRANA